MTQTRAASAPAVVKVGGSTLGDHDTSLADIAALHADGCPLVVVHGGGANVSRWMQQMGVEPEWIDGLRVTTPESLHVVAAVLRGLINAQLVRSLVGLGAPAVGLAGADNGMIRSPVSDRLGLVGEHPVCNPDTLQRILADGLLPVVAPLGIAADDSTLLNINADGAAGAVAAALRADSLLFLTDVDGVLDQHGCLIHQLDADREAALAAAGAISGGMLPKLRAGREAQSAGATIRIVDGRRPGAVRRALSTATDHQSCPDGTLLT